VADDNSRTPGGITGSRGSSIIDPGLTDTNLESDDLDLDLEELLAEDEDDRAAAGDGTGTSLEGENDFDLDLEDIIFGDEQPRGKARAAAPEPAKEDLGEKDTLRLEAENEDVDFELVEIAEEEEAPVRAEAAAGLEEDQEAVDFELEDIVE
jgi:hypothetical protein